MNQEGARHSGFEQQFGASEGTQDYFAENIFKKLIYK